MTPLWQGIVIALAWPVGAVVALVLWEAHTFRARLVYDPSSLDAWSLRFLVVHIIALIGTTAVLLLVLPSSELSPRWIPIGFLGGLTVATLMIAILLYRRAHRP